VEDGKIQVRWKAHEKKGTMRIWMSTTNEVKAGGKDAYRLVKQVPLGRESATLDVAGPLPSFVKIVLEAPHNTLNRWIVGKPPIANPTR
jgi:hypothetical protein